MVQGLFRSVLFSFQVFRDFHVIFLLFISSLITVVREHTVYDFNSFQFVEICFMAQDMAYFGIWSVGT